MPEFLAYNGHELGVQLVDDDEVVCTSTSEEEARVGEVVA